MPKIKHCGSSLKPVSQIVYKPREPLKVPYASSWVDIYVNYQCVTVFEYHCPGGCVGTVYYWQGTHHDGSQARLEKIRTKHLALWAPLMKTGEPIALIKKGASAVQGSQRVHPYRFKQMIQV